MKKTKLLSGLVMLILCIAVIGIGIYAVTPTTHTITGTITVTQGGNLVKMQLLYNGQPLSGEETTRHESKTLEFNSNVVEFNCDDYYDAVDVPHQTITLKLTNLTKKELGVYFLGTQYDNEGTASAASERVEFQNLKGTETLAGGSTRNVENVIKASFPEYSIVPSRDIDGGVAEVAIDLELLILGDNPVSANIDLFFGVEEYVAPVPVVENGVAFNTFGLESVSVTASVENASVTPTATLNATNVEWQVGTEQNPLKFSDEKYKNGDLRLRTVKLKMLVTNEGETPIKATIIPKNSTEQTAVKVIITNAPYIAGGDTEEVSVQFQAIYDRESDDMTDLSKFPINDFSYRLDVKPITDSKVLSAANVYDRIQYDSTGMGGRGLYYYIEYGDNPYYSAEAKAEAEAKSETYPHREKLRWYVWAKYDGYDEYEGRDYYSRINSSDEETDSEGNKKLKAGRTYNFISEYALSPSVEVPVMNYQTERYVVNGDYENELNLHGDVLGDYTGSSLRKYLNGEAVRAGSFYRPETDDGITVYATNGKYLDFYNEYGLTKDPIFSQISGTTDKFWTLSQSDFENSGLGEASVAYKLSAGSANTASEWWLCTPSGFYCCIYYVRTDGTLYGYDLQSWAMRPVFRLDV